MSSNLFITLAVILIITQVIATNRNVSRNYTRGRKSGYTRGWAASCHNFNKTVHFTKSSLTYLRIWVLGSGEIGQARKVWYNYFQIKRLAQDKDVVFKKKTVLLISGYLDSPIYEIHLSIAKTYKDHNYTVLMLDYHRFVTTDYPTSARNAREISKYAADMLIELTKYGLDIDKFEVLGISLGAHTMGFIAKHFRKQTGRNLTRITALDPAGPCFRNLGPSERLDRSDANFLDVLSTNIDGFGMAPFIGHVQFYVNGGEYQPSENAILPCDVLCSHLRSYSLWTSSFEYPESFIAIQCDSVKQARQRDCYDRVPRVTNILGLKVDQTKQGIFYLSTTNVYPYYMGYDGLDKSKDFVTNHFSEFNTYDVIKLDP